MQAPKRKTSQSRRDMRRAHDGLKATYGTTCQKCGANIRPHHVCPECGQYRGRQLGSAPAE